MDGSFYLWFYPEIKNDCYIEFKVEIEYKCIEHYFCNGRIIALLGQFLILYDIIL